jgi:putative phage-type endonuclease
MTSTQDQIFHVLDLEQGTREWLDWRHSGIGASEASTVMGDNRFQSPSELLYQKKNKINTEPNEKMRLGTSLEPDARDLYIEETGILVEPQCLQSKEYSWMIASMDGITDDYAHIVEIKCGRAAYWQANKGNVPSYYYGQLQHQLMITGLDLVDYWCYWPGYEGILQTVTRDERYIGRLLRAEKEFIEKLNE